MLRRLVARSGEPVIRQAVTQAMRILGRQFVMGRTIEEALDRARAQEKRGYRYSYDMLGESARTARGCRALRPRLSRRHRGHRPRLGGPRPDRGAGHLGQALGAASALRIRPAPARDGRAGAAAGGAGAPRQGGRYRLHHRCRGGRSPRPLPRCDRGGLGRSVARRLERASASPSRPIRSACCR